MNLKDALKWLNENETEDKNICYITKMPIKNEIKLECGHSYEYEALHEYLINDQDKYNTHNCPYCRRIFPNFIPFYETDNINKLSNEKLYNNTYLTCQYIYKSGKKKNTCCNKYAHKFTKGIYCFNHHNNILKKEQKILDNSNNICIQKLKNGKPCKCKIYDNETNLCKRHFNIKKS